MKIILSINNQKKVNETMIRIIKKAIKEIKTLNEIANEDVLNGVDSAIHEHDILTLLQNNDGIIESTNVSIQLIGEEIHFDINDEFIDDYLNLVEGVSCDIIGFVATYESEIQKKINEISPFLKYFIMKYFKKKFKDLAKPFEEMLDKIEDRLCEFAKKYM